MREFDLLERAKVKARDEFRFGKPRRFYLGAVGIRVDGAYVHSVNHDVPGARQPSGHAEARLLRKLGKHGVVAVARYRRDGLFANARPCEECLRRMKNAHVSRIIYSIADNEYGMIDL